MAKKPKKKQPAPVVESITTVADPSEPTLTPEAPSVPDFPTVTLPDDPDQARLEAEGQAERDAVATEAERRKLVCQSAEIVRLDTLQFDPENARLHNDANLAAIMASLAQFGQDQALVVQRSTRIVRKGNGRMEAMLKLGWTEAAVVWVDDDDATAKARAIADNRTSELATWNVPVLLKQLGELEADGQEVQALGFSAADIKTLRKSVDLTPEIPDDVTGGEQAVPSKFQILVTFKTEAEQTAALKVLTDLGYDIRSLIS